MGPMLLLPYWVPTAEGVALTGCSGAAGAAVAGTAAAAAAVAVGWRCLSLVRRVLDAVLRRPGRKDSIGDPAEPQPLVWFCGLPKPCGVPGW